jgi:Tfp pilus assembly protein PilP
MEEAPGRGHVVREGMCIGIHGGKVAEIRNDQVIIQEEIQDVSGNVQVVKTEMKLKKSAD